MRYVLLYFLAALTIYVPAAAGTVAQPAALTHEADDSSPYCGPFLAEARATGLALPGSTPRVFATPKAEFTPYIGRPDDPAVPLETHTYVLSGWPGGITNNVEMRSTPMRAIAPKTSGGYIGGNLLSYRLRRQDYSGVGLHLVTGLALSRNQYLKFDYNQVWKQSGSLDLQAPIPSVSLGFRY